MGPREGTTKPKERSGAFTKSKKMKRCKKWNTYRPQFKSKKEERNRQFLLNEKEEMIEKIWLVLSLSFLISKSKNKFGFEKNIIKILEEFHSNFSNKLLYYGNTLQIKSLGIDSFMTEVVVRKS